VPAGAAAAGAVAAGLLNASAGSLNASSNASEGSSNASSNTSNASNASNASNDLGWSEENATDFFPSGSPFGPAAANATNATGAPGNATVLQEDLLKWLDDGGVLKGAHLSKKNRTAGTCGQAQISDLTVSLRSWRKRHLGADGFCYFQNLVWWFPGKGSVKDYRRQGPLDVEAMRKVCGQAGYGTFAPGTGPAFKLTYDGGTVSWAHVDDFIDLTEDVYCHSLGWLKGQRLDGAYLARKASWEALASAECQRMFDAYHFGESDMTIVNHLTSRTGYMRGTLCALKGGCSLVSKRTHYKHAYANCLLDSSQAAAEMAYCYHKGCVLRDGRIGHGSACGY